MSRASRERAAIRSTSKGTAATESDIEPLHFGFDQRRLVQLDQCAVAARFRCVHLAMLRQLAQPDADAVGATEQIGSMRLPRLRRSHRCAECDLHLALDGAVQTGAAQAEGR